MMKASRWQAATPVTACDGDSAATMMPATAGPAACCSMGRMVPSMPLAASRSSGRQDAGQDRGVGREEECGAHAQHERSGHQVPELQPSRHGKPADAGDHGQIGALHGDDQQPLRKPVRGDPAGKDERHQSDASRGGHQR